MNKVESIEYTDNSTNIFQLETNKPSNDDEKLDNFCKNLVFDKNPDSIKYINNNVTTGYFSIMNRCLTSEDLKIALQENIQNIDCTNYSEGLGLANKLFYQTPNDLDGCKVTDTRSKYFFVVDPSAIKGTVGAWSCSYADIIHLSRVVVHSPDIFVKRLDNYCEYKGSSTNQGISFYE
jgi:hypothetical protein